ncbi:MAG: F0F1 ATP synthase subunit delta [Pseudomonadota bacterium]|nr:F0F1 ATP synthase subunit delta [Pseudomonadota bacterium]
MSEQTTLARPYAKAIFQLARDAGNFGAWSERLDLLAQLVGNDDLARLIDDPRYGRDVVQGVIQSAIGEQLGADGLNFVRLLLVNRRLKLISVIAEIYEVLRAEAEGTIDVDICSAVPLQEQQSAKLAQALKDKLGREVRLTSSVDENLLGGAVIRAGDLVIDGSVRSKLDRLSGALVH